MHYEFSKTCQIPPADLDRIYHAAWGDKTDGVLVEIGAHDGYAKTQQMQNAHSLHAFSTGKGRQGAGSNPAVLT